MAAFPLLLHTVIARLTFEIQIHYRFHSVSNWILCILTDAVVFLTTLETDFIVINWIFIYIFWMSPQGRKFQSWVPRSFRLADVISWVTYLIYLLLKWSELLNFSYARIFFFFKLYIPNCRHMISWSNNKLQQYLFK